MIQYRVIVFTQEKWVIFLVQKPA